MPGTWKTREPVHLRAARFTICPATTPGLADGDLDSWRAWLGTVWEHRELAEAIRHASPVLAARTEHLMGGGTMSRTRARRLVEAVMRYVLRAAHRPTPFGLFAGVTTARVDQETKVLWHGHHLVCSPSGAWVAAAVGRLESSIETLRTSRIIASSTAIVESGQLVVPQYDRPGGDHELASVREACIAYSPEVATAMTTARTSTLWDELVQELCEAHPGGNAVDAETMLARLVQVGALRTDLRPVSTASPLNYLQEAATTRAPKESAALDHAHRLLGAVNSGELPLHEAARGMSATLVASSRPTKAPSPIGVDLLLDADITLPRTVLDTARKALQLLEKLTPREHRLPGWQDWTHRFLDRYGTDHLVPVTEAVSPEGIGFPDWSTAHPRTFTDRDRLLMELATTAALDRTIEVAPDTLLPEQTDDQEPAPIPPHVELGARLESPSAAALDSGRFRLAALRVSRNAGTITGRFTTATDTGPSLCEALTSSPGPTPVQLSFPTRDARSAHVVRAPQVLDHVVHIAEHPAPGMLEVRDLAVGHDGQGLFVWSHTLHRRITPVIPHALNLRHAPALARFLTELTRSAHAPLRAFSWGAADTAPFLPRLRSGRIVLSPARWRIRPRDLPPARAPWSIWDEAWSDLATRRFLPDRAELGGDDQLLHLDLSEPDHRHLLRTHLNTTGTAHLREAPDPNTFGWSGGRPAELVIQCTRTPEGGGA